MKVALPQPWTAERFLDWAGQQDAPHEFDGTRPVAMTGGDAGHSLITGNLHAALRSRLRGTPCTPLGPDAGVATTGDAIRYPDALVTCSRFDLADRLIPGVVVVFEVLSPTSGRIDRIVKVREYAAVASIRRYVIVESTSVGLTVLERPGGEPAWRTSVLTSGDILTMPEIGIEITVAELYDGIELGEVATAVE